MYIAQFDKFNKVNQLVLKTYQNEAQAEAEGFRAAGFRPGAKKKINIKDNVAATKVVTIADVKKFMDNYDVSIKQYIIL